MVMNKLSQLSGYSINEMENQEMMSVLVEEEKPMKPPSTTITSSSSPSSNSYAIWANLKPFAYGGAAGMLQYSLACFSHLLRLELLAMVNKSLPPSLAYYNAWLKLPGILLFRATYTSMQFGSFETFTRKVEAGNNRMPLTLYQEACCGLSSGAIAASIGVPWLLAHGRVRAGGNRISILQDLYRKCADEGALAPWKGGRHHANYTILINVGMLTPYNRCFNCFRESLGLSEDGSTVGAGLVSGFFASACSLPYMNVCSTMMSTKPDANGKSPYSSFLDCAIKSLKSRGPLAFFTGFSKHFLKTTSPILILWSCLEAVRKSK
ncbi:mitochondrial dicarboxylate/tricarboxylate transporter DTC-like isoform X2 [Rhododendron vialii]|uniref:mitochondrial dicarboxylate/tricarboxylate transporter DTC-like isoform X2 n=1 Tax=Rhododendron vialii TaxID=182163 RepID=UPI00265E9239|nr:mitochondrial dicarboxylate/tricarboxylate transporter DTC-like isoform X2 [Rhododendron vialii]